MHNGTEALFPTNEDRISVFCHFYVCLYRTPTFYACMEDCVFGLIADSYLCGYYAERKRKKKHFKASKKGSHAHTLPSVHSPDGFSEGLPVILSLLLRDATRPPLSLL